MTMTTPCDRAALDKMHALVGEALALADAQQLHAAGIALDTARLAIEDALDDLRPTRGVAGDRWIGRTASDRGKPA